MSINRNLKIFFAKFKRKKENKFDHIISLGYNCEVTFRFLKYFKFEEPNLFNWTFSYTINDLIYALQDFEAIGSKDFAIPDPLWECNATHIRFHGKADISYINNNMPSQEIVNTDKKNLVERIKYLKEKFLKIAQNDDKKLYIYKIKDTDISDSVNEKINSIIKALNKHDAKNYKLLIISEEKYSKYFAKDDSYIYRTVKYFADDNHIPDRKYFDNGWDNIYEEYYQIKNKNSKKKKKYKFER